MPIDIPTNGPLGHANFQPWSFGQGFHNEERWRLPVLGLGALLPVPGLCPEAASYDGLSDQGASGKRTTIWIQFHS